MSVITFKGFYYAGKIKKVPVSKAFLTRFASSKNEIQETEIVADIVENVLSKKKLEQICNKSRLNSGHRNLVSGQLPYDYPVHRFHNTVKFKRRMYGRYGDASNIYPGLAWPTIEELNIIREYESVAYPLTIHEMQQNAMKRLEYEQQEIQVRQQKIDTNMKKLNGWLKEVKEKAEKKFNETQKAIEKRENLIEEVKKHFGYKIDPKDERFKEMLAKREKEEKKKIREEKKRIREEKYVNFLKSNE